jgi:hypothetical protein
LQVVNEKELTDRVFFYRKRHIAFIARPPAGRRGLFKKASNMNYSLTIIKKVGD